MKARLNNYPLGFLKFWALPCLIVELLGAAAYWKLGAAGYQSILPILHHVRFILLVAGAVVFGMLRISVHPELAVKYRDFLHSTPWTPQRPLPNGWPQLVVADAFMFALAVSLSLFWCHRHPFFILLAFTISYGVFALGILLTQRQFTESLALAWLLPGVLLAYHCLGPGSAAIVLLGILAIVRIGLVNGLDRFPVSNLRPEDAHRQSRSACGGYFALVGPSEPQKPIPLGRGIALAALVAWWLAALLYGFGAAMSVSDALVFSISTGVLIAFLRWIRYCAGYGAPITLWGRLRTGHLLIPGYDRVLLTPLLITSIALIAPMLLRLLQFPSRLLFPVSVFITLSAALELRPTFRHWQLTGAHRMVLTLRSPARG